VYAVSAWSHAFALTCLVELAVAVPLIGRSESALRRTGAVLFAQLASHPAVWFVFPALHLRRLHYAVGAELWAVAIELVIYRLVFARLSWLRAFAISALANGASFAVGTWLG
jgi:hypothetical protein